VCLLLALVGTWHDWWYQSPQPDFLSSTHCRKVRCLRQGMYYLKNIVYNKMRVSGGNSARVCRHDTRPQVHAALTSMFCRLARQMRIYDVRATISI